MKRIVTIAILVQAILFAIVAAPAESVPAEAEGYREELRELNERLTSSFHEHVQAIGVYDDVLGEIVEIMKQIGRYDSIETRLEAFTAVWNEIDIPEIALSYIDKNEIRVHDIFLDAGPRVVQLERPRPPGCGTAVENHSYRDYSTPKVELRLNIFESRFAAENDAESGIETVVRARVREEDEARKKWEVVAPISLSEFEERLDSYVAHEDQDPVLQELFPDETDGGAADILIVVYVVDATIEYNRIDKSAKEMATVVVTHAADLKYHVVDLREGNWMSGNHLISNVVQMSEVSADLNTLLNKLLESVFHDGVLLPCEELIVVPIMNLFDEIVEDVKDERRHKKHAGFSMETLAGTLKMEMDALSNREIDDTDSSVLDFDAKIAETIELDLMKDIVRIYTGTNPGAGFYITNDVIMTAYHVVSVGGQSYVDALGEPLRQVLIDDHGTIHVGFVVAFDVHRDLALVVTMLSDSERTSQQDRGLRIQGGDAQGSDTLSLGKEVFSIGHPLGLEFSISRGIISGFRKYPSEGKSPSEDSVLRGVRVIQTDAVMGPGSSGGPLVIVDDNGVPRVIGVNIMGAKTKDSDFIVHHYAIAYPEIRTFLRQHGFSFTDGTVTHPFHSRQVQ